MMEILSTNAGPSYGAYFPVTEFAGKGFSSGAINLSKA